MENPKIPVRLKIAQILCRWMPPIVAQRVRDWIYPFDLARKDAFEFSVRAQTGSIFRGNTADFQGYPFSVHGYSCWRNLAVAAALISDGDTVVEIGANICTETIGFSDLVEEHVKVQAFELLPGNLRVFRAVGAHVWSWSCGQTPG